MAVKRKSAKAKEMNIEDVAKLYATYDAEMKAIKAKADDCKKQLIEHAENNRDAFDNNRLTFDCGVYVESRQRMKVVHNDIDDLDWIENVSETRFANMVTVALDAKVLKKAIESDDSVIHELIDSINACIEVSESMAVYSRGK